MGGQCPDGKLHHSRCPRLLAALESEQLASGNGDFVGASAVGGGSGTIVAGVAPRASPEVSETELSLNQCQQRASLHRNASLTNGSDNNIHTTEVRHPHPLAPR